MRISPLFCGYIARHFSIWLLSFFLGLAAVIFIADSVELLRRAAAKPDVGLATVLHLALLKLPQTTQTLMPFAVLFGAIMAFWRLTRSNELIVARAAGISVWQFLAPALIVAIGLGIVKVALLNQLAAVTFARYEVLEARLLRGQVEQMIVSPAGLWLRQAETEGATAIIHADQVSRDLRSLGGVMILRYDPQGRFLARVDAPTATLSEGAWIVEPAFEAPNGQPSKPIGRLVLPTDLTPDRIQESFARPETMSFWALPDFISVLENAGFSATRHRLYLHSQLAVPVLLGAMVLIAATFSLRSARRGGVGLRIGLGVIIGFGFYLMNDLVQALGKSASIPVELAAWTPAAIGCLFGLATLLYLEDG